MLALLLAGALFASCNDDDDVDVAAPTFSNVEIGSGNNKQAQAGSDFHIEAQIVAPGDIDRVQLEIHPENGSGWELDTVYTTGLAGLKNAELHEHIDVPAGAALGDYHQPEKKTNSKNILTNKPTLTISHEKQFS